MKSIKRFLVNTIALLTGLALGAFVAIVANGQELGTSYIPLCYVGSGETFYQQIKTPLELGDIGQCLIIMAADMTENVECIMLANKLTGEMMEIFPILLVSSSCEPCGISVIGYFYKDSAYLYDSSGNPVVIAHEALLEYLNTLIPDDSI